METEMDVLLFSLGYAAQNGQITLVEYREAADYLLALTGDK
jgi:hypothetical protein